MKYDAVVDSAMLNGALTATAEAIREKTGDTEPIPFDMDDGFKVAVDSISIGGDTEAAYNEGVESGRKAEYDAFWDAYLNPQFSYVSWGYRFAGNGWNDATFNPPHDIVPKGSAACMFAMSGIIDLKALCDKIGVVIDFSKTETFSQMFADSNITHIGIIDTRAASHTNHILFNATKMATVDKIILKVDGSQTFTSGFINARELNNITFEGTIGKDINLSWSSLLSDASVQSIIEHLKDLSGQVSQTLTFHATVGGKLTAEQKAAITAKNWTLVY